MIEMMARLHKIDYKAVGLSDYGRPEAYIARQVSRWTKQYQASIIDPIPEMDRLIEWLPKHIPGRRRDRDRAWRFPPRQSDHSSDRAAHHWGA